MDPLRKLATSRAHHIKAMLMIVFTLLSCTAPAALAAHQSVTDVMYGGCNTAQFSSNDTFAANLNTVKEILTQNSSLTFYSFASSHSGSESNDVFGIYQCRGDVSLSDCSVCVRNALSSADRVCGYQATGAGPRGARLQYKGCYIRYENYPFTSGLDQSPAASWHRSCSPTNSSSSVYQHNLGTALNITASAAPKHALFGYNASSAGTGSSNQAYALSQCLGYLSHSQCAICLSTVSNFSGECGKSVSAGVFFVDCYYLYDNASFLFTYDNSTSGTTNRSSSPSSPIASPTQERNNKKSKSSTPIIITVVVGASFAIAAAIVVAVCCLKRRKKAANPSKAVVQGLLLQAGSSSDHDPLLAAAATRFSLKELREATQDFNPRNKLGEGGFGPVFQGTLKSGRDVAIKKLSVESRQGNAQFVNEVNLINTIQHRNLVQLIGYCIEDCHRLLVYEHLPNRSLDLHLFDVDEKKPLHWHTRLGIIVGIARGLTYLHQDSHLRIVHRDIKASNVLLDNNLNPKIADFGLARLFGDDMSHLTTKVVGTLGYLSPEYAMGGQLSEKADVYSFGVVALEIVSGRRVVDSKKEANEQNLLEWTWALYEKKQQLQIVDRRMQKDIVNEGEVVRVVHVALLCTQSQPHLRPSMCDVYSILNSESNILDLPTKPITMAMFTSGLSSTRPSSISECSQADYSVNTVPVSEVEPR